MTEGQHLKLPRACSFRLFSRADQHWALHRRPERATWFDIRHRIQILMDLSAGCHAYGSTWPLSSYLPFKRNTGASDQHFATMVSATVP